MKLRIAGIAILLTLSSLALAQSRPADTQTATATAPTIHAAARSVPITFARSGRKVTAEVETVNYPHKEFVLRAFGRTLSSPAPLQDERGTAKWTADFDVPAVRTPTVFAISPVPVRPVNAPQTVLGELAAYPDGDVQWDKKVILLGVGAPRWFEQWATAIGLPVQWSDGKTPATLPALRPDERCLLVLGSVPTQRSYREFLEKQCKPAFNILILDASWMFAEHAAMALEPAHLRGALASMNAQKWGAPLSFSDVRVPNRILCNRWPLVEFSPSPPLEVVGDLRTGPWITLSGIPWQEQLGRRGVADELLLELLKASATFAPKVEMIRQVALLYPENVTYDRKTMAYCPALACVTKEEKAAGTPRVLIVDLRGPQPVPAGLLDRLTAVAKSRGKEDRLLLIGDDPILDQCEWLKIDREKKTTNRPGVVWLADDQPWDKTYEIPLMQKLTELGVPLAPPSQEEKKP